MQIIEHKKRAIKNLIDLLKIEQRDVAKGVGISAPVFSLFLNKNNGMQEKNWKALINYLKHQVDKVDKSEQYLWVESHKLLNKINDLDNPLISSMDLLENSDNYHKYSEEMGKKNLLTQNKSEIIEDIFYKHYYAFFSKTQKLAENENKTFEQMFQLIYTFGLDSYTKDNNKQGNRNNIKALGNIINMRTSTVDEFHKKKWKSILIRLDKLEDAEEYFFPIITKHLKNGTNLYYATDDDNGYMRLSKKIQSNNETKQYSKYINKIEIIEGTGGTEYLIGNITESEPQPALWDIDNKEAGYLVSVKDDKTYKNFANKYKDEICKYKERVNHA